MAGAALIATAAALRSGVGLTTVACQQSLLPILQIAQPCAMCLPLPEEDGAIAEGAIPILEGALAGKTALAIGCGLSLRACAGVVRWALSCGLPAAVDADALNHIAQDDALRALLRPRHVITPHPGEAARLLGRSAHSCLEDARALHTLGPVALLKGADSYIAGERDWVSGSGAWAWPRAVAATRLPACSARCGAGVSVGDRRLDGERDPRPGRANARRSALASFP